MTCHSSSVPITPMSVSHVTSPARRKRRQARGTRRPAVLSRTASATIEPSTQRDAEHHRGQLQRRRRGDEAGVDVDARRQARLARPPCRSVKMPATCGFFSGARVPAAPGIPTKSAPTCPTLAQMCRTLQVPEATAGRGATAATESRNATNTVSALARTNSAVALASMPPAGHCGQHDAAFGGQRGDGPAGNGDVEGLRRPRHQRRGDVGDQAVGAGVPAATGWWRWSA